MSSKRKMQERSRREFLSSSLGVLSAAAVAGLSIARSAHAAGSDVIKVGLIGCGGRGSGAAANALSADPAAKLVAMADLFDDKVRDSRQRLGKLKPAQVAVPDDRCFSGFDGYRGVLGSDADVVLIACTSKFHPQYLKACIAAGKHAFLEKPHAIDVPGVQVVAAACQEAAKKKLSVVSGLCWRYHTCVQETMQRVFDGAIGDIVTIQETYLRSPYRLVERLPGQKELEYQFRNWYHFNWLSGDDIIQSLIHSLDKGAWAMRDEPPVRAFGVGGRSSSIGEVYGDVFDHNAIVYEYANGVRMYGVGRAQNGCYNDVSDWIFGSKGHCNLQKGRIEGAVNWQYQGPKCNMQENEQAALLKSIRSGTPLNNGSYMASTTLLGLLGRMVCYSGKEVTWENALKSSEVLGPSECSWDMEPLAKPLADRTYPVPIPGLNKAV